jgi:methylmalonyl-CoA/ethylmalonyl-CoA epimerase
MSAEHEPLGLDHIGIAVRSIDEAVGFYRAIGLELSDRDEVPEQGVRVGFLPLGDTRLELLEPTGPDSPIAVHLERRGPGLHHICVRVDDIRAAMQRLSENGYRLLSDEPQIGAHECLVCFVHPRSTGGVLVELSQPTAGADD